MRNLLTPTLLTLPLLLLFTSAAARAQENFLILIADDVGVDKISAYGEHPAAPQTPSIDAIAAEGVLFRNAWSNPGCTSTRVATLSGRYGFRTGVGGNIPRNSPTPAVGLDPTAPNIANALKAAGYNTAAFGKWHVAGCTELLPGSCDPGADADPAHPVVSGFDYYAGKVLRDNQTHDQCNWSKTVSERVGGEVESTTAPSPTYMTTDAADEAIARLTTLQEPWFGWVAFNASHRPLHVVPEPTENCILPDPTGYTDVELYDGMTEKLDDEIGRLLAGLGPSLLARTTVVFFGDNGTIPQATAPPFDADHAKGKLFEGGVNVPFIVSRASDSESPAGVESAALVNTTDLFATLMDLAGSAASTEDSVSLLPHLQDPALPSSRSFTYAERFHPNGSGPYAESERAIRNADGYKLIRRLNEIPLANELYDLEVDAFETTNLFQQAGLTQEQSAAFEDLLAQLGGLVGTPCLSPDDLDGDCVNSAVDNCSLTPNGPGEGTSQNQCDTDQDGYGNHCDGDFNGDGIVDSVDFVAISGLQGSYDPDLDMNCDGLLDAVDTEIFDRRFGNSPGPSGLACAGSVPCVLDLDGDGISDARDSCLDVANAGQADTDLDGFGDVCDADCDGDGLVSNADFLQLGYEFGRADCAEGAGCQCDLDGNGAVANSDQVLLASRWGLSVGPSGLACAGTAPCLLEVDGDAVPDSRDNCLDVANSDQADTDLDGFGNLCDGDCDGDGLVGNSDFFLLSLEFGTQGCGQQVSCQCDLDGDGTVAAADGVLLSGRWGKPLGPSGLACAGTVPCTAP